MKTMLPALFSAALLLGLPAVTSAQEADGRPSFVVTTEVLGSLVTELVGDAASVTVLMESGADPHTWQPSARDSELIFGADLVIANGLGLEEGLSSVLGQAEAQGVPVFHASDHVVSPGTEPDGSAQPAPSEPDEDAEDDQAHDRDAADPHIWLDPLAMREVVVALGPVLAAGGVDLGDRAGQVADELTALDAELVATLSVVPPERRRLVSGHGALGRFADRYGFDIVGTVVPGLSSADEPSARDIAELVEAIRAAGVDIVFSDVTTPPSVAEAVAAETGARIVLLAVEQLPPSGRYADLMREVAATIVEGLAG